MLKLKGITSEAKGKTLAKLIVLRAAVDGFCANCMERGDGQRPMMHRIKACDAVECSLHPVRPGRHRTMGVKPLMDIINHRTHQDHITLKRWTNNDEHELLERKAAGEKIDSIAIAMRRSNKQVQERLRLLGMAQVRAKSLTEKK